MRILDIRESTVALVGAMASATVDFSGHTVSLVAIISDQRRGGVPVVGFAFNSIGQRMIPRLMAAESRSTSTIPSAMSDLSWVSLGLVA